MVMPPWASRVPVPLRVPPVPQVKSPVAVMLPEPVRVRTGLDGQGAGGDRCRRDAGAGL